MRSHRYNTGAPPKPATLVAPKAALSLAGPPATVVKKSGGGPRNWLILGAVAIGAYYVYTKFGRTIDKEISQAASHTPGPDLDGPFVTKFEIASTKTPICISAKLPGFAYAPISSTNPLTGYSTFSATVAGNFTRRVLCSGGRRLAAEIKPRPGLAGLMGLGNTSSELARRLD